MDRKQYWEKVYQTGSSDSVSWLQEHAGQFVYCYCRVEHS
jgi:hypothetical protein